MLERLREIRDKMSLEIQGMSALEMETYFKNKKKKHGQIVNSSVVAEPKPKYGKTAN